MNSDDKEQEEGERTTWRGGDGWLEEEDLKLVVETAVELAGAAAAGRGRKEKKSAAGKGRKAGFLAYFGPDFLLLLSMKLAPIYRAGKRVILSSTGKKSQPLIRLEEFKLLVQSVHLELPNLAIQGCRLNEVVTLGQ